MIAVAALALSLGPGHPVCGRATFDRRKAAEGGAIFVTDDGRPGDEDALRLSEGLIVRRGGASSRAAIAARLHGIPAVALGRGIWEAAGPSLRLSEPTLGAVEKYKGMALRAVSGDREIVLREGDAVCVDPAEERVEVIPPAEADARLAAAAAARAFDGLRDEPSLERWLEAQPDPARAAALMRELAPRALEGVISAEDLARAAAAARRAAGAEGEALVSRASLRAWSEALKADRPEMAACADSASEAPSGEVLDRLAAESRATSFRAAAAGRVLGAGDGGFAALAKSCASAAARRRPLVPRSSPSLDAAAEAAGASPPEAATTVADAWPRFAAENGLRGFLDDAVNDASLGLRRKSARIRERILEAKIDPSTEAGRAVVSAAAVCPCLIVGEDATVKAADSRGALAAAKRAWAASWEPGPLGARLRAGRGSEYDGSLRFSRAIKADASGVLLSRDPGSGAKRASIEAAAGDAGLDGSSASERWVLELPSGRVASSEPPFDGGRPLLTPARLRKLARLARALDVWRGGGIEAAFSFSGDRVWIHDARPLEPPRLPRPLSDPFSPRLPPEALNVKPVGR